MGGRKSRSGLTGTLLAALLLTGLGCHKPVVRPQSDDEPEKDRYGIKTVGELTSFGSVEPLNVAGVGLVVGLEGTGSPAPAGDYRQMLEKELLRQKVPDVKKVLNSSDCSLVLVSALIPAGARKGDRIDIEVSLPPGSKTTSLKGGYLKHCLLYNYDLLGNLNPEKFAGSNRAVLGHAIAHAEGPVTVGFGSGDEQAKLKTGRIWGGGRTRVDRPLHLILHSKVQSARVANLIATRINSAFAPTVQSPGAEVARFQSNAVVLLKVPHQYQHNLPRFLRVVRLVPVEESPVAEKNNTDTPKKPYRMKLQEDLRDPARTVTAALRLEALGQSSIEPLKSGLQHDSPLVRFCAAEALAYLGSPACGEELARVVRTQPYLRAYALTAMASLDEAVCHVKLREVLTTSADDETRYGAFRALRALDERDPDLAGELLNEAFWLHRIPSEAEPLVHVSVSKRPEIVLFGSSQKLRPPFAIRAGEFVLTASAEDERCSVTHIPLHGEGDSPTRSRCSLELAEIIKCLAAHGAAYSDILEVIRQASELQAVTCRVRVDALPQAPTVQDLARAGRNRDWEKDGEDVVLIKPDRDMGGTPTLFQKPGRQSAGARALIRDRNAPDSRAERSPSRQ